MAFLIAGLCFISVSGLFVFYMMAAITEQGKSYSRHNDDEDK